MYLNIENMKNKKVIAKKKSVTSYNFMNEGVTYHLEIYIWIYSHLQLSTRTQ